MNDEERCNQEADRIRLRDGKLGIKLGPGPLKNMDASDSPWYESEEEIRERLRWGTEKAKQLSWVRSQMTARLTEKERQCVRLYYFKQLSFRQIGAKLGINVSSVYRAVGRGVRKLREAAEEYEQSGQ